MDTPDQKSSELSSLLHELTRFDSSADVFSHVVNNLHRIIPSDRASVSEYEPGTDQLKIIQVWGSQDQLGPGSIRPGEDIGRSTASSIRASISQDKFKTCSLDSKTRNLLRNMGVRSILNTPLITRAGVIGSLNSGSKSHTYNDHDLNLLKQIAAITSAAVERIELGIALDKESKRHREYTQRLQQINKLAEKLTQVSTVAAAISLVGNAARSIVPAQRISYIELHEDQHHVAIRGLVGNTDDKIGTLVALPDSGLQPPILKGRSIHITDLQKADAKAHRQLYAAGYRQLWAVPLHHGRSTPSVLAVTSTREWFGNRDTTSLVHTVCRLLGATIERIDAQTAAENSLRTMVDDNPAMLLMLDEQGSIQRVSRFGAEQFGYNTDHLNGKLYESLHPVEQRATARARIDEWNTLEMDAVASRETQMKLNNGSVRWVRQTARRTRNAARIPQLLIACEDIDDAKKLANEMKIQARTDALTRLPNRIEFAQQLDQHIANKQALSSGLAIFFMDLDHFKNINDTMGHQTGDRILRSVARRMETLSAPGDVIARIGGDEFLMLVAEPGNHATLARKAEKLIETIEQDMVIGNQKFQLGISIGSARYPEDAQSAAELIKKADIAMYHAKDEGRHQVQPYTSDMLNKLTVQVSLENDLKDALRNRELSVVYQPKVIIATGAVKSLEALVRWNHPEKGFIPPDVFIPIAEQCGLISKLTQFVLEESLQFLCELRVTHPHLTMAVNVSAVEFAMHDNLKSMILAALEKFSLAADVLELELTETALLKHPKQASELIEDLVKRGMVIAVDDFGTGYASLNYLVQLPIGVIKIDRSFISNLTDDKRRQAVVSGVIGIANGLDVMCIAEGVETQEQARWLQQNHCSQAQGYLYCKPLPPDEIEAFLRQQKTQIAA